MSWQRPNIGSRMNREVHVRFWERAEVKFLRATRHSRRFGCFGQPSACPLRIRKRRIAAQQRNDAMCQQATMHRSKLQSIRSPRRRGRAASGAHLVLSFERQPEDELTIHRHDGVEVETDMVVDRGHVAPSALQWMAMLQAAAASGVEDQIYRRLSLIGDK